jgi:glycosyltransferase involved in cell wall biosynthesis
VEGRSAEIAAALGGEARCFYGSRLRSRPLLPVRYALNAARTVLYLARSRPRAVIATNPPIVPGLVALAYATVARAPLMLDSHPTAFGKKDYRPGRLLLPIHRSLARRAVSNLVASEGLAEIVRSWDAQADVVHEAPPAWRVDLPTPPRTPAQILFVGQLGSDEPVAEVLDAARRLPSVAFNVTGDPRRCPAALRDSPPDNVRFVGFLRGDDYARAMADADLVLALTTEPTSVVRAGYEAVYAQRPLVTSDWPALRENFPKAIHARNEGAALASALSRALADHGELVAAAPRALELQERRWQGQLAVLRERLDHSEKKGN